MTGSSRRIALLSATCAVLAGVLVTPAGAATRPKFELSPVTKDPYPRFVARRGQTVSGAVRLHSRSAKRQTVRLQALDLVTARTGGIEYASGRPHATGAWLKLQRRDVVLPARATRIIHFTARVPSGAAPGQHYAGIVAIDRAELRRATAPAGHTGVVLRAVTRIALPVRFRLPGKAGRSVAARRLAFAADASGSRLDLDLRSTGQLLIRETKVDLRVARVGGRKLFRHKATLSEFVPKTTIRYPIAWRGTPTPGVYRVSGTVTPKGGRVVRVDKTVRFGKPEAKTVQQLEGVPPSDHAEDGGPPLMLIALGVAVLLAIVASVALPAAAAPPRRRQGGARGVTLHPAARRRAAAGAASAWLVALAAFAGSAPAAVPVNLGQAAPFAVLGATTVTSAGTSTITGNLGVSPGTSITGFPPGVLVGTKYTGLGALGAHADVATAYTAAILVPKTADADVLGGRTIGPGVHAGAALSLAGTLTLDAGGDPNAVFILKAGSTLTTSASSFVSLTGAAQACNVFWLVGSSATLGATLAAARQHPRQHVDLLRRGQHGGRAGARGQRRGHARQRHGQPRALRHRSVDRARARLR